MMGCYIVVEKTTTLVDVARKISHLFPCALYFHPEHQPVPKEPHELLVEEQTESHYVRFAFAEYIEPDFENIINETVDVLSVSIYWVSYLDTDFFKRVCSCLLMDLMVKFFEKDRLLDGATFLKTIG
jgi:hypothetical protein